MCSVHYNRLNVYGRLERINAVNRGTTCKVSGCDEWAKKIGYCSAHYQRLYKTGTLDGHKSKRAHKYYHLWFERKQHAGLTQEWMEFWRFVEDIGERPGDKYTLARLRSDEPYGPDNFEWREHLKRKPGETKKAWHARKWKSRRERFPKYERNRWYLRKYGITAEDYDCMLAEQGNVCAICGTDETAFAHHTGEKKRLSVDHNHATGRVRGLLCFRCNSTIGRLNEEPALLDKMQAYLSRHESGSMTMNLNGDRHA
jgi:hypothetical protein